MRNGLHVNSEVSDGLGKPLLLYAVEHSQYKAVARLIAKGADLDQVTKRYPTPLYQAVTDSNHLLIELLLKQGADVSIPFNRSITPIMKAANWCDIHSIQLLLDHGADMNKKYSEGHSAYEMANQCKNPEFIIAWNQLKQQKRP